MLQVAPSSYYDVKNRKPSARMRRDEVMGPVARQLWVDNYRGYGARKICKAAQRASHDIGWDQAARLMAPPASRACGAPSAFGPPNRTRACRGTQTW